MSSPFVSQQLRLFVAMGNNEDLVVLKELVEAGKVTPVIDRVYPLSETPKAVAAYGEEDRLRVLNDAGIIHNRLKIDAAIENARRIVQIQKEYGSFAAGLDQHHPRSKEEWVKLFKKTFRFTSGEITGEFLMSTGYLSGAHAEDCPVYGEIVALSPPWMRD